MEIVVLIAFAAGVLQGTSGFGFTLVMSPLCALLLPGHAVVGTVVRSALAVDVTLARLDGRGVDRRLLASYAAPAVVAAPIALFVAQHLTAATLNVGAGVATLVAASMLGRRRDPAPHGSPECGQHQPHDHRGARVAGFASGLLGVTTGLSGPPLAVHVNRTRTEPGAARGTLAWLFVAVDGLAVLVNRSAIAPGPMMLVTAAAVGGTLVGRRGDGVMGTHVRRNLSITLIAAAGLFTLLRAWG